MAPSSPTSPMRPGPSPRSPLSPMDVDVPQISPLPQLMATILSAQATTPTSRTTPSHPWQQSNGTRCRRNSQASPITSPTSTAVFTPMSPAFSSIPALMRSSEDQMIFQHTLTTPTSVTRTAIDGRQSRMAMRSPMRDRVLTLPLRVNTNVTSEKIDEKEQEPLPFERVLTASSDGTTLVEWAPAVATTATSERIPSSASSPTYRRRLVRSHNPSPITTARSPIRKNSTTRTLRTSTVLHSKRLPPPPKYHVTVLPSVPRSTVSPRTARNKHHYLNSVEHLRAPLVPLISVTTGQSHPTFPKSLLQYHLLTHEQLDSLARWYHQVSPPIEETFMYPAWIPAWTGIDASTIEEVDLETKRRRWGRFIGLRGCESPTTAMEGVEATGNGEPASRESPQELARRMEREWRRALERAEEESRAFEKSWRGRW